MPHHDELQQLLGELVQANSRLVRIAAHDAGSAESPATWRTLRVLQQSGPMRIGELATLSRVAQPTMTKIVAGLAERGWVARLADESDARAWLVDVTDTGVTAVDEWLDQVASALYPYFAELSDGDVDALRRTVQLLQERVELNDPIRTKESTH
ncbi:MarR family winged helix-turn-helix transcriptional regulator [Gryllotalpicola reticulitermitis]|uniref:MarR family winged helix-turn-helix transcriptional regulator n=1 Tax=Gryllotalpicola reticulitermitis TaxID=1184153 RepID=A0ABV8Q4A7_9MICO